MSQPAGSAAFFETGVFTAAEAARLLDVSPAQIRSWIGRTYQGRHPVFENEVGWLNGKLAFGFFNLIELKFLAFFLRSGVKFHHIRSIIPEVRSILNDPHFLAKDIVFKTDGKNILAEIARQTGGYDLFDLKTRNFMMYPVVLDSIKKDLVFRSDGSAGAWWPRRELAPNVIVNPRISFGQPTLVGSQIPTKAIFNFFKVEKSYKIVADLFQISVSLVREAVKFERSLQGVT